jgi:hypothetical protein
MCMLSVLPINPRRFLLSNHTLERVARAVRLLTIDSSDLFRDACLLPWRERISQPTFPTLLSWVLQAWKLDRLTLERRRERLEDSPSDNHPSLAIRLRAHERRYRHPVGH